VHISTSRFKGDIGNICKHELTMCNIYLQHLIFVIKTFMLVHSTLTNVNIYYYIKKTH